MSTGKTGSAGEAADGFRTTRARGAIVLVLLLALGVCASAASAEPLSMTFTEARANVGVQLSDAALFEAPDTAPFEAQIDPGSGSITAGVLEVPEFSTHITDPLNADVTVEFEIGTITGSFTQATDALTLSGVAGGTLTSNGKECTVSTIPSPLTLSTTGNSGGTSPRSGAPFTAGLSEGGAIAGQWTDMTATPVDPEPGGGTAVCETVEERIEGPGGIWLRQEGAFVPPEGNFQPPTPPKLTGTDPASPGLSGTPRILGAAKAGSTVRVYAGPACGGLPLAAGSAAELGSPGIPVQVAEGITAVFSATATDAGGDSACSAPISYTRLKVPPPVCVVPELAGKKLAHAKAALKAANCAVGKVTKARARKGRKLGRLVVKSSQPSAGKTLEAGSEVDLRLGPRPRKTPH